MKRIPASIIVFLTAIVPAVAAETTEPGESLPDTYPACMEVNGPDCVIRSQSMLPPTAPQGVVILPADAQGVVILPAAAPPGSAPSGASNIIVPARGSTIISPRQ